MNVCAFCGPTEVKLTKEHVWPRWVSRALSGTVPGDRVRHRRVEGNAITREWDAGEINLQVKALCGDCNGGWLSDFEAGVAMPLLSSAISHGRGMSLTCIEQASAAAWVCKMAMIYELANPKKPAFFTAADRLRFREWTKALPEVEVRLARHQLDGERAAHAFAACQPVTENFGERRRLLLFLTTVVIGNLAAQLIAVREEQSGLLLPAKTVEVAYSAEADAALVQVWPPKRRRAEWPPPRSLSTRGVDALSQMWADLAKP